jgi:hypothetical protein
MRHLLAAAAMAGMVLVAVPPAESKSIWLECGHQVVNLDSAKERFSLTYAKEVYQGRAVYNPGQIDFEFQWITIPGGIGIKSAYSISRKSLEYIRTTLDNIGSGGGWLPQGRKPEIGKCSIMKTPPTAGNQI